MTAFLPISAEEMRERGWEQADVVFVTGDAYVDHPSFAMALLGRLLEADGFRVAILPQPDWRSVADWRALGAPRLCYAVSSGNMDSMINHYTASRKRRNDDAYSPGGRIGLRPDRATAVYAQRCREAFRGIPVVIGGIEASLRRIAHHDHWSGTVRPSVLLTSKADLLVFGSGERILPEIVSRLQAGESVRELRDLRGTCYLLGQSEEVPEGLELPPFEQVAEDHRAFAEMTRLHHRQSNPLNAPRLLQRHGNRVLVHNPPGLPLTQEELDRAFELPYCRRPHPRYQERIPAFDMIRDSVTIMRGCFGGCAFCSITLHEGRHVQSRSEASILREIGTLAADPGFRGTVSDLGGPTANLYRMGCSRPEVEAICRRLSCLHPRICKLLETSHGPLLELLRRARHLPGVRRVLVASGIRMDLANLEPGYIEEIARHHVGGQLRIAPEHVSERVLALMQKPTIASCDRFAATFAAASRAAGREQYLVLYLIAGHPGATLGDAVQVACYLHRNGYRPRQVQDFIPTPMDLATAMYRTGLDPMTMRPVQTATRPRDRKLQRALFQYFLPENWSLVRQALRLAGRQDLIGDGPDCLIPRRAPPGATRQPRRKPPPSRSH